MSTHQPPGGPHPEGTPGYTPPQDPWGGGFEQGVASVPTDAIRQQYDPYGSGQGDVWSQETVVHGGQYGPPPQRSRVGIFLLVFVIVLVLGGGGGFTAWYLVTQGNQTANPSASPTIQALTSCPISSAFDPCAKKVGECLINLGDSENPVIEDRSCTTAGTFKILKIFKGPEIVPKAADGSFDRKANSEALCQGTTSYKNYYARDSSDNAADVILCLANNTATTPTRAP